MHNIHTYNCVCNNFNSYKYEEGTDGEFNMCNKFNVVRSSANEDYTQKRITKSFKYGIRY